MDYTIVFKEEQLNILSAALGKMPFETVAPLIKEIQKQLNEQQKTTS